MLNNKHSSIATTFIQYFYKHKNYNHNNNNNNIKNFVFHFELMVSERKYKVPHLYKYFRRKIHRCCINPNVCITYVVQNSRRLCKFFPKHISQTSVALYAYKLFVYCWFIRNICLKVLVNFYIYQSCVPFFVSKRCKAKHSSRKY